MTSASELRAGVSMAQRLADRAERARAPSAELDTCGRTAPVPPSILGAVRDALLGGETHYTSRPGIPELRQRLAREVARLGGPTYGPDAVVVTASDREALCATLLAMRFDAGAVLVSTGAAARHARLFRMLQLFPAVATRPPAATRLTRLVYREWPGDRVEHDALRRLAVETLRPGAQGIGDVVGMVDFGTRLGRAPGEFPPLSSDHTILIGSLDSLPGLASFGLGFVAGPPTAMGPIRTWKQALSICTPAPSQRAALAALETAVGDV